MNRRGRAVAGIALGLYLTAVGVLTGMLVERVRFDRQRASVLARYEQALRDRNLLLMTLEKAR